MGQVDRSFYRRYNEGYGFPLYADSMGNGCPPVHLSRPKATHLAESGLHFIFEGDFAMSMRKRHLTAPKNTETFDGIVCKLGHDGRRYVATGQCVTCVEIYPTHGFKSDLKRIAADGFMPTIHGRVLLFAQNGRCAYCGASGVKMEIDHKVSIEFGGNNWPKNRQWLCRTCNRKKWCYSDADFRKANGIAPRTRWDAPAHIVALLDKDARLLGDSFLKARFDKSMNGRAALEGLLKFSRRTGSPIGRAPAAKETLAVMSKVDTTAEVLWAYVLM